GGEVVRPGRARGRGGPRGRGLPGGFRKGPLGGRAAVCPRVSRGLAARGCRGFREPPTRWGLRLGRALPGAAVQLAFPVPGLSLADKLSMNVTSFFGQHPPPPLDRRAVLKRAAAGFGYLAFAGLCAEAASPPSTTPGPLSPRTPHHRPRARRVIFLFMHGGPRPTDTFHYKPRLHPANGKPPPL